MGSNGSTAEVPRVFGSSPVILNEHQVTKKQEESVNLEDETSGTTGESERRERQQIERMENFCQVSG